MARGEEGEAEPEIDDDGRPHRRVGLAEPGYRLVDEPDADQDEVHHAEQRVQHPLPHERHRHRREGRRARSIARRK